jgi:hypothetical protein
MKNNITIQSKTLKKSNLNSSRPYSLKKVSKSENEFKKPDNSVNQFTFEKEEAGDQLIPENINQQSNIVIPKKNTLTEEEIQKKLDTFRNKLLKDLMKILSEEKHKEEERELLHLKTTNVKEKKRLENIISMERAQSSEKIIKFNEYLLFYY